MSDQKCFSNWLCFVQSYVHTNFILSFKGGVILRCFVPINVNVSHVINNIKCKKTTLKWQEFVEYISFCSGISIKHIPTSTYAGMYHTTVKITLKLVKMP